MLFDSSKWWEYSSALDYIFRELIDSGIIASKDSISNIDFNIPKYIGSDIAIWVEKSPKIGMLIYPEYSPLLKIEVINKVINIWINNDLVLNWIGSQCNKNPSMQGFGKKLINGTRIAVEHTSLNTVFPINLATFRSSVIGDATKRYLLKQGAIVKSHFFIEDLSQRNQVLLTGARISGFSSHRLNSLEGKPDHELGYLYASTVMSLKYPGKDHRKTLSKMFPKAISKVTVDVCYDFDKLHWGDYAFSELFLQLKTYCIEGFEQTLKLCGIDIDYYDHEAITYSTCISEDDEFFVNSPSPLERNICYFKYLASTNDLVFSILPINLMYQPNYDDSLAGRLIHTIKEKGGIYDFENRLHFFPYGKVEILEDRSSNPVSDSISEGIFTSLDSYLENVNSNGPLQIADIINSIKLTFLSQKRNSSVIVMKAKLDQKGVYFDVVNVLKRVSGILSKKDIPTSKDIYWSDSEKKLLVNLLSFEKYTVQQGSQIPEFRKLVWAIQMTSQQINHVVQNILKSNMLFSNQMTLIVVGTIMILNVFDSLGITSSEGTLLRDIQNTIDQTVNS